MRLLYLLNKKPKGVVMPPDGVQLLVWAERILEKYPKVRSQTQTKPQVHLLCIVPNMCGNERIMIYTNGLLLPPLLLDQPGATIK